MDSPPATKSERTSFLMTWARLGYVRVLLIGTDFVITKLAKFSNPDKIKSLERQIADMKKHKESKKAEPSPKESSQTVSFPTENIFFGFLICT